MLWLGIAIAAVAGIALTTILFARGRPEDLGSVSDHWVAEHRADSR